MDDPVDMNEANYGLPSLTSSPSVERYTNSVAPSDHNFENAFSFNPSLFDTIEPSSLDLFHTSHDDNCLDKCPNFGSQGVQRNVYGPTFPARPRYNTASLAYAYQMENSHFQLQAPQFDNQFYMGAYAGNQFNVADLGASSQQQPVPEDTASVSSSKYSCSDCCSNPECEKEDVCQQETCADEGVPCDSTHCLEDGSQPISQHPEKSAGQTSEQSFEQLWDMHQGWHAQMQQDINSILHNNEPCNHTNTEHDVAITLRDLSAPAAAAPSQHQNQVFQQLGCHLNNPVPPMYTPQQFALPIQTHPSVTSTPDINSVPPSLEESCQRPGTASKHVCQWILPAEGLGIQGNVCGHVCNDSNSLQEHLCEAHVSLLSSKTKYLCSWKDCTRRGDQSFPSRNKLTRHMLTHTGYKPYECETCHQSFSAQQALDQHVRTHTGETPFKCDYEDCGKAFKQQSALTMHKRTHTGEKPLVCEECGKRFCESSNLSKHRKTHNAEFMHKCEVAGCGREFLRADQLRRHQLVHEDRRKRKTSTRRARARGSVSSSVSLDTPVTPETPATPQILEEKEQMTETQV